MNAKKLQKWIDENGIDGIRASKLENVPMSEGDVIFSIYSAISAFQRGEFMSKNGATEGQTPG